MTQPMMTPNPLNAADFLTALQAAAKPALQAVHLPGVGHCHRRDLTVGDALDADDAVQALQAHGLPDTRRVRVAVSVAQTLCDAQGQPLLNAQDPAHVRLLCGLPWSALAGVLSGAPSKPDKPSKPAKPDKPMQAQPQAPEPASGPTGPNV